MSLKSYFDNSFRPYIVASDMRTEGTYGVSMMGCGDGLRCFAQHFAQQVVSFISSP
jgi:hypothetical protein